MKALHEALWWKVLFVVVVVVEGSSIADSSCRGKRGKIKLDGDRSLFMRDRFHPQQTRHIEEK